MPFTLSCRPFHVPFYVGTAGPVAVIYIFNWVLYIIILVSLIMRSRESINKEAKKQIRQQLIVAMSLAVLFGLGWGIGFVATEELPEPLRLLMSIVFNCLATFQGLFIFLFQCVYPKSVRQVWKEYINKITPKRSKGISTFGTSSEARFGSLTKSENLLSKQPISSTLPGNEMKPLTDGGENH